MLLQGRQVVRAEDIAEHFGVSVRTAYRDLRALDQAGVPIAAEAGIGYSLVDGYHLPPVIFTSEEAGALFFSGALVERFTDESVARHARAAIAKIRAVLPSDTRNFVERLEDATAVYMPATRPTSEEAPGLDMIQQALVAGNVVRLRYYAHYRDSEDERHVEPLALVYYGNNWHLIAYCRMRNDVRDFRIDRIRSLEMLNEQRSWDGDFSVRTFVAQLTRPHATTEVVLRCSTDIARHATSKYYYGLVDERACDDGVTMTFMVSSLQWIAAWILSFGASVTVVSPPELRDVIRTTATEVAELYTCSPGTTPA